MHKEIISISKDYEKKSLTLEDTIREAKILNIVSMITESFVENTNIETVFNKILEATKEIFNAEVSTIIVFEDNSSTFVVNMVNGKDSFEYDEIVYKKVLIEGSPTLINNLSPKHSSYQKYKKIYEQGCKSLLITPLSIQNRIIGLIGVFKTQAYDFTDNDLRLLKIFSTQSALIIQNARLFEMNKHLAITDDLTQLYNFRLMTQKIEEEFERAQRYQRNLTFLMIDVDHFKKYNDTYGHLAGDIALKTIAKILKTNLRSTDVPFRYGGEEFSVLLVETDKKEAFEIAERIREAISKTVFYDEKGRITRNLSVTVGISSFTKNTKFSNELVRNADDALYTGKRLGRNRTVISEK